MRKTLFSFIFLVMADVFAFAQNDTVAAYVSRLEARGDHNAVIEEIGNFFKTAKLNPADNLALQTVLVHKYIELQQWDSCINFCQQQIVQSQKEKNTLAEASFYKLIGNMYYALPDKNKACDYWRKCIAICLPNNHNLLLEQCYHNLGAVDIDHGVKFDEAENFLLQAVSIGKQNSREGSTLFNQHNRLLATLYERINRLDKAETLYLDVIERSRELRDTLRLAESLMFYSDVLIKQKKFEKAIEVSDEAVKIARRVNMLDLLPTALTFHAKNLYMAGRFKEAYDCKSEEVSINSERFSGNLHTKVTEAEAKFKNADAEHEKQLAIVKANKEKQFYIFGLLGLLAVGGVLFYSYYQRRNIRQKLQVQAQVQNEKERLSRDLHDNLGSQMALLSNNIENLEANYKKNSLIDGNIETVRSTSKQLLQTLRETLWILNREEISVEDFFDKLVDYAHRYLHQVNGMRLTVEENFSGNKMLLSNEALQLFRICQEAINNSCKYSGSDELLLSGKLNGKFTIEITDWGKGFEQPVMAEGHYGLKNMKRRAQEINAEIIVESELHKGVSVRITI